MLHGNKSPALFWHHLKERCKEEGIVFTNKQRVVLQVLMEATDHPDVMEIHRRSAAHGLTISACTVYRTIRLFEKLNIVRHVKVTNDRKRFEIATDDEHHHLIDTNSGEVIEFSDPRIDALYEEIARQLGYQLLSREIKLYGQRNTSLTEALV